MKELKPTVILLLSLSIFGCLIPRTETLVPGAKGVVTDSVTGKALKAVVITESSDSYAEGYEPKEVNTNSSGDFEFLPEIAGTIYQLMAPGAGVTISRELTFEKTGYQTRFCTISDLSLFSEPRFLQVSLSASTTSNLNIFKNAPRVFVNQGVSCSLSYGDEVEYKGDIYTFMNAMEDNGNTFVIKKRGENQNEIQVPSEKLRLISVNASAAVD